ncbi:TonB-dependent receptor plug domain-containing protein [Sphingobacterium oryzagri]|uniref:TonB-dependent receptor plug domain-containing protein n=1 Tax=Sphingobacterium oryzagri TaxID=3025669 RepID=A0ABY7WJ95_9SPHI|nr:TonB-dependent receptor plug domain-containing protein [Sphingobacterium sp. KACC 22765]WDF67454.1 TonB-dependent receptor plug domain-containing protein [Sphingobacterium sp. KACC 22765]
MIRFILLSLCCAAYLNSSAQKQFQGFVLDQKGMPLSLASVTYLHSNTTYTSGKDGRFAFDFSGQDSIRLKVAFIGKRTVVRSYAVSSAGLLHRITLDDLSLTLEEVSVLPTFTTDGQSNSSITIDKQAIDQLQAFSLVDVMNSLPGKKTAPLDLNSLSTLTFRGTTGIGDFDFNNSRGIAIIVDDMRLSNDANMQARGLSRGGIRDAGIKADGYRDSYFGTQSSKSYDTPFQGIDLRDIPVNNIEKIEVIQGIAPARYGDVTNGAVIIDRQAGRSPYVASFNINGGSTSSSISKGFQLPGNWGALNTSANWTYSNADPKDKVKTFHRFSEGLIWTTTQGKLKNTLSLDFSQRKDEKKQDPDDESIRIARFSNYTLGVSNRLGIDLGKSWMKRVQINLGMTVGKQDSYASYAVNRGLIPIANMDTSGIYEGVYSYQSVMTEEHIIGKPLTASASMASNGVWDWGKLQHAFSYGVNYTLSNNGGRGVVSDPDRPRLIGNGNQNLRPYSFEHIPAAQNVGVYIEDQFKLTVGKRTISNNIGLRYDIQNGFGTLQPRINTRMRWNERWAFTAAFGVASKAPSLADLYPGPTYIDYDLITATTGSIDPSLYLLFTDKILIDNSQLKPAKSIQFEFGVERKSKWLSSSLYAYFKRNYDGFTAEQRLRRYVLPKFDYWLNTSTNTFEYAPVAGELLIVGGFLDYNLTNGLQSDSYGVEWFLTTPRIPVIQTSFSLNTSYSFNRYKRVADDAQTVGSRIYLDDERYIKTVYYAPLETDGQFLMTKLNTVTHIPSVGFVVNFSLDLNIFDRDQIVSSSNPIAILDDHVNYYRMEDFGLSNEVYRQLVRESSDTRAERVPFVYGTINMGLEKEIGKNIRINMRSYNLFDIRPYKRIQLNNGTESVFAPNRKPSITIGTTLKF